jgi:hypothetical protein
LADLEFRAFLEIIQLFCLQKSEIGWQKTFVSHINSPLICSFSSQISIQSMQSDQIAL